MAEDYEYEFDGNRWDYLGRMGEVGFNDPWKFMPDYEPKGAFWGIGDCDAKSSYTNLLTATNSFIVFPRPFPYESIYIEWVTPPQGGQYILEYVSKTTTTSDGREIPYEWKPLEVTLDETNGFHNDGLVKFKTPKIYTEWKRAFLVPDRNRKEFMIRLRTIIPPQNKPKMKCGWASEVFRFYPLLKENNNELYLGYKQPFSSVKLYFYYPSSTPTTSLKYILEYPEKTTTTWQGTSVTTWQRINFTDTTNGFRQNGTLTIQIPSDWQEAKIGSGTKISAASPYRYWLRLTLTATPTVPVVLIKAEIPNQRQLYRQEIFSTKYLAKIFGWDDRNDRNKDNYLDDNEYQNLINPQATARYKWHSRLAYFGWSGSLDFILNFNISLLKEFLFNISSQFLIP